MDTTDPEIQFDPAGRCNHCLKVDRFKRSWSVDGDPVALEKMFAQVRADGRGRDYDAIAGLSGGVDSSYLLYAAAQHGIRVLVIHVDTGWNSELAVRNIELTVSKLKFDLVTHVVDWEEMQDLQLAFLRSGVPNQDIPQDHAINSAFFSFAAKHGARWALAGSNLACEGILPKAWGYDAMDLTHLRDIHRRFGKRPLKAFPTMSYTKHWLGQQVFGRLRVVRPLNLMPYRMRDAISTLERELGWKYYGGKHYESRFTKFFQGWYLPTRWGYDKRLAHLSSLVATGQLSRDQAMREFEEGSLPTQEIEADHAYMAAKLDLSREQFDQLMRIPIVPHSAYRATNAGVKTVMKVGRAILNRLRS